MTSTSVTPRVLPYVQQQIEHVAPVRAIEIAGRLVGEDQRRIVGQRARDRNALLLAARELRRIVMAAIVQPDFVEQRLRARRRIAPAGDLHRHLDVFDRGQRRHEMKELEDEADLLAAQPRQRVFIQPRDFLAADRDRAARRRIQTGDQIRAASICRCPTDR